MKDVALAIKWSKRFESLLRRRFDARGRGLHELITSCGQRLDRDLIRQLRFIATIRNKLAHEESFDQMDDRAAFLRACKACRSRLEPRGKMWLWWMFLLLAGVLLLVWAYRAGHLPWSG